MSRLSLLFIYSTSVNLTMFIHLFEFYFFLLVCEISLFRILQVMNLDVDETVTRNQIHI